MATDPHPTPECEQACERESLRLRFQAMLHEIEREAKRDGAFTIEDVLAELDEIIDAGGR